MNALLYITLIGICLGLFNLQTMTLFQTSSPSKFRGRIMSLLMTISSGLLPLGLLTGGVLGTLTNNNTQLIFSISAGCIALLTIIFVLNSKVRQFLLIDHQNEDCTT